MMSVYSTDDIYIRFTCCLFILQRIFAKSCYKIKWHNIFEIYGICVCAGGGGGAVD